MSLVTQCAEAGSSIKQDDECARHDSSSSHGVPSQQVPGQLHLLASASGRSVSESRVPRRRERQASSASVRRRAWADESRNSSTSSTSSSTLNSCCLDAALSVHNSGSQSIMVPLELPSPMPESSSEGDALTM